MLGVEAERQQLGVQHRLDEQHLSKTLTIPATIERISVTDLLGSVCKEVNGDLSVWISYFFHVELAIEMLIRFLPIFLNGLRHKPFLSL